MDPLLVFGQLFLVTSSSLFPSQTVFECSDGFQIVCNLHGYSLIAEVVRFFNAYLILIQEPLALGTFIAVH